MRTHKRPVALLTAAQVICIAAMCLVILFALNALKQDFWPGVLPQPDCDCTHWSEHETAAVRNFLAALTLTPCFLVVGVEAFRICGRMKTASAFSAKNELALGRIAMALLIAGVLLLHFGQYVMDYLLFGLPEVGPVLRVGLPSFTVLTIALMLRAVQVLMRRALDMQEESDLTV